MINLLEDSSTFRGVYDEGERAGLRKILIRMGTKRFGPPTTTTIAVLDTIEDIDSLQDLIECVVDAKSWSNVVPVEWRLTEFEGTVHGRMIELDDKKAIPKGTRVRISIAAFAEPKTVDEHCASFEGAASGLPNDRTE